MPFPWLLREGQTLHPFPPSVHGLPLPRPTAEAGTEQGTDSGASAELLAAREPPFLRCLRPRALPPAIGWSRIHNLRNTDREKQAFSVLVQHHLVFSLTGCSLHLTAQRKHPRVSCSEPLPYPASQWMQLLKGSRVGKDGVLLGIIPSIWRLHSAARKGSSLSKWKMGFTSLWSPCGLLPLRYYF